MRVLGIDPGTVRTGWGVVERVGGRTVGIGAGVIRASKDAPLEERLAIVYDGLVAIIEAHAPAVVAVEDIYHGKFANAALKLGHVRGVALLAAAKAGLVVEALPASVVKRSVAGRGSADKAQVARIVGAILGWRELPAIDATDALAVAITRANALGALVR